MGEEVEAAPLSDEAHEVLEWLADALDVSLQDAAEMAAREGLGMRRDAMRRVGKVIPFRQPRKA